MTTPPISTSITAQPSRNAAPAGAAGAAHSKSAAARRFETMAIAAFLKPMFKDFGKADAPFGGGNTFRMFRPYFVQAVAQQMERDGGLNLEPAIARALSAGKAPPTPMPAPSTASLLQPGTTSWTGTSTSPQGD